MKTYKISKNLKALLALATCLGLLACGPKKDEKDNLPTPSSGSLILSKFQGVELSSIPKNAAGKYLTKVATLSFSGYCGFGAEKVEVTIDTVVDSTVATCGADGSFSWSGSATADLAHDLIFTPKLVSGSKLTPTPVTFALVSDTILPVDPAFTFPATSPYEVFSAPQTLTGTTSCDTVKLTSSSAGTITFTAATACPGAGTFSQDITLNAGETRTISIVAQDAAGNSSASISTIMSFGGSITNSVFITSSVGVTTAVSGGGGDGFKLEHFAHSTAGSAQSVSGTTSGSSLTLGFIGAGINAQ